jgi:hypothetical protein
MHPVQRFIRDEIDAAYPAWRLRATAPLPTRSGDRYLGIDVATLLASALKNVGLHVYEEYETRYFVSAEGKHFTRERLTSLIVEALEGHPDATLRASIGSAAFWTHLADRLPYYEGETFQRQGRPSRAVPLAPSEAKRRYRAGRVAAETASAEAFLAAVRPRLVGTRIVSQDLYEAAVKNITRRQGETITAEEDSHYWTVPRRSLFYRIADEEYGVRRRHARGTAYVVRALRRLSAGAAAVLRFCGVTDPEAYADEAEALVGEPAPPAEPDPALAAIAEALPLPVVFAVATAEDDPRRAFGLFARDWLTRHPADAETVSDAARAFGPALVEAIRYRAASALAEDA